MKQDRDAGLDERCRDENGTIRRKRSDTRISTLRRQYGEDFAADIRSDATLGTVLDRAGVESLSEYLRTRTK